MKTIKEYAYEMIDTHIGACINEAANKERLFLAGLRVSEDFSFKEGEKVMVIKYDTHHYRITPDEVYTVTKVNKNSVKFDTDSDFLKKLKFDKYGINVNVNKNKYIGNSTQYRVLYNKALLEEKDNDIEKILASKEGTCPWGFSFNTTEENVKRYKKEIKDMVKEIRNQ